MKMKFKTLIVVLMVCISLNAQKKKNGTIFIEHPAFDVVDNLHSAMNSNNSDALSKIIADDFRGVAGDQMNKDAKPQTKTQFIQQVKNNHEISKYFNIRQSSNGYPDAVEYKDENFSGTWVYSWEYFTAVGGTTGIDYSQPRHTQYVVNKDNQIAFARYYLNQYPYSQTSNSQMKMKDGDVYSHHSNINTVRRFVKAFQYNDDENLFVDFAENVNVNGLFNDWGSDPMNLDGLKSGFKTFKSNYKINSMDNMWIKFFKIESDSNFVQSWWRLSVTRKNDGKEIVFPVMFNHTFNDDGKIVRHWESWNEAKLQ
ncbi:nuclear transport factor 2 family protein [Flavobacteriaceae bacterium]|nr:nuclear transport factor 2 family protein [Flavobacteriaceae bacterium]